jgi:type I restriction enzyme S subunit
LKALIPKPNTDSDYLLYALTAKKTSLTHLIGSSAHGTKRIGTSAIEEIKIPVASIDEQTTIAQALKACEDKVNALEKELSLLEELFKAMLEELMTGRLSAMPLIEAGELEASTAHT